MTATLEDVAGESFDFVICGGGTAGLTLAARLTEDPSVSVLALEAGAAHIDDPDTLRPASHGSQFGNESYDWSFRTVSHSEVHQTRCRDTHHVWNRGKGLGGSSIINFMVWTKPTAEEINDFERLGNPGWNWNNYQKYVARTEGFISPHEEVQRTFKLNYDAANVGSEGPLKITYPATIDPAELKMQQTLINAGVPVAANPMGGDPAGAYFAPSTYDPVTHTRSYATTAFYLPNAERPNLKVLVCAHARRVCTISAPNGNLTAVGVEFEHAGRLYTVSARKEVVIAMGALQSPQMLELSGIGNKEVLEKVGIPTKIDLPGVGRNVQEHLEIGVSFELRDDAKFDTLCLLRDPAVAAKHLELHKSGSGLYTTGITNFAFVSPKVASCNIDEIARAARAKFTENAASYPPGLLEQYDIQLRRLEAGEPLCEIISYPGFMSTPNPPLPGKRYVTFTIVLNSPFSRGSIHCSSSDPLADPELDPHYLEEDIDLQIMTEMVKFVRGFAQVPPFKDMISKELNPGAEIKDDIEIINFIKRNYTIGSCSMLPKDRDGVVDPELKVSLSRSAVSSPG
ncbi:Dehydrogenase citC [Sparassis crispa]|uniref:Dehydrogenase citC n=1 Tax=Sparassis crispa TaxID=139825 RepID=A0A401H2U8_9APHY|nr:Dehydrogenase citC [Sparassis crispa]GBE88776.1 Dehydrogenase citC [Sparassis crispa]